MEIGVETVSFVHSLAPARQTLSKGTTSPQIFRPFTPGLEKATVMSVSPTVWVTDPLGLGRGRSSFVADCASAALAERMTRARTTRWFRRCKGLPPGSSRAAQHSEQPGAVITDRRDCSSRASRRTWNPGARWVGSALPEVVPDDARLARRLDAVRCARAPQRGG